MLLFSFFGDIHQKEITITGHIAENVEKGLSNHTNYDILCMLHKCIKLIIHRENNLCKKVFSLLLVPVDRLSIV